MGAIEKDDVIKGPRIRKDILEKVEQYRRMSLQYRNLERELEKLKKEIQPYMEEKGITEILDETGQGVVLEERRMPDLTTRYTTYDIDDMIEVLDPAVVSECIVEVIDRDIVEAKVLLKQVPQEISELKRYKLRNCFVTK
ncbi:hypothetical protein D1872_51550 [compost metagenome]